MAIYDERDARRPRMDIDDLVERDASSAPIIILVLIAAATIAVGTYLYNAKDATVGIKTPGVVTQKTTIPTNGAPASLPSNSR